MSLLLCIYCSLPPCLPCSILMDTKTISSLIIPTFSWSVGDLICLKVVIVSIPQDSSWYFSFKLAKPWQWLVIVSKEVEVVGLKNVFSVMWFTFTFRNGFLSFGLCSWFLLFLLLSLWQMLQATGRLSLFYIVVCFPVWKSHQLCWEQDVCLSLSASCSVRLID